MICLFSSCRPRDWSHELRQCSPPLFRGCKSLADDGRMYRSCRVGISSARREQDGSTSRSSLHVSRGGFHIKAGVLSLAINYFAAKVNANFPDNPGRFGLPTIQGMIILSDADNGSPLAILDSADITALRTAAA